MCAIQKEGQDLCNASHQKGGLQCTMHEHLLFKFTKICLILAVKYIAK